MLIDILRLRNLTFHLAARSACETHPRHLLCHFFVCLAWPTQSIYLPNVPTRMNIRLTRTRSTAVRYDIITIALQHGESTLTPARTPLSPVLRFFTRCVMCCRCCFGCFFIVFDSQPPPVFPARVGLDTKAIGSLGGSGGIGSPVNTWSSLTPILPPVLGGAPRVRVRYYKRQLMLATAVVT